MKSFAVIKSKKLRSAPKNWDNLDFKLKKFISATTIKKINMMKKLASITMWRILTHNASGYKLIVKSNESYIVSVEDKIISSEIWSRGSYDFHKIEKAISLLRTETPFDLFIDIGANLGSTCIPMLTRNLTLHTIAIEPDVLNFKLLKMNILLNNLENRSTIFNSAASESESDEVILKLNEFGHFGDHKTVKSQGKQTKTELISVVTVNQIVKKSGYKHQSSLAKIDVEGFEYFVLKGATDLLKNTIPLIIEFWPFALQENCECQDLVQLLTPYEYFFDLSENSRIQHPIVHLHDLWNRHLPNKTSTDLLFAKAE